METLTIFSDRNPTPRRSLLPGAGAPPPPPPPPAGGSVAGGSRSMAALELAHAAVGGGERDRVAMLGSGRGGSVGRVRGGCDAVRYVTNPQCGDVDTEICFFCFFLLLWLFGGLVDWPGSG